MKKKYEQTACAGSLGFLCGKCGHCKYMEDKIKTPTYCFDCGKKLTNVKSRHINILECKKCSKYFPKSDVSLMEENMRNLIKQNYKIPLTTRLIESIKSILLFPFEFILIILIILISPFHRNKKQTPKVHKR